METKEQKISRKEFIKLTDVIDSNVSFSHIFYKKKEKMNKGGREGLNKYYDRVMKYTKSRVLIGMEYEKRRQKTEPEFKVGENKVFDKHLNSLIGHNTKLDRYYLKFEWFDQVPPKSEYFMEGKPINKDEFKEWLPKHYDNVLNYQVVDINNLQEITINKVRYILHD